MNEIINWLLDGDVSIQYMTHKYILRSDQTVLDQLQNRITTEGFGKKFLSCRSESDHWGLHFYQPKWTSTHYTLLDLKNLCVPVSLAPCREMVTRMFNECMNSDGGVNLSKYEHPSDICVDGMVLNYASYFCADDPRIIRLAKYLIPIQKADGGFTWDILSEKGDPHTTVCVLEGLGQFNTSIPVHGHIGIEKVKKKAIKFLLSNMLFINDADNRYRKLSYPYRYRYDLLRVLEYFVDQQVTYDTRMQPAIDWLYAKRKSDGLWYLENQHKGNVHFQMEELRQPSRFITLKALYVCKYFDTLGRP